MDSNRKTAITTGIVFIAATAANLLGTAIEQPILAGTDYLTRISADPTQISIGGLFELIAAGTSASIAILLYPVLKSGGRSLALGAVIFRAMEAVMYTLGAVSMLALRGVAQQFTQAVGADRAWLQALGDSLLSVREVAILAGVFAFAVGALMYSFLFYRSRLIPRWLSGWGIVAELLMLVACLSALYSGNPVTSYAILILPIAMQEMVLAVWLIVRGFSSGTLGARTVAMESTA